MKDPLIDSLVDDLTAVTPWNNQRFWFGAMVLYIVSCIAIVWSMGVRSDFENALQVGTLVLKPALFLGLAISAAWLANDIAKPAGQIAIRHSSLALLSVIILILLFSYQYHQSSSGWVYQSIVSQYRQASGLHCVSSIFIGGAIFMLIAWFFWVSKAAANKVKWLGALSGMASGAFMASAYALHCSVDAAPYLMVYYCLPILALAGFGYVLGGRYLKW